MVETSPDGNSGKVGKCSQSWANNEPTRTLFREFGHTYGAWQGGNAALESEEEDAPADPQWTERQDRAAYEKNLDHIGVWPERTMWEVSLGGRRGRTPGGRSLQR